MWTDKLRAQAHRTAPYFNAKGKSLVTGPPALLPQLDTNDPLSFSNSLEKLKTQESASLVIPGLL